MFENEHRHLSELSPNSIITVSFHFHHTIFIHIHFQTVGSPARPKIAKGQRPTDAFYSPPETPADSNVTSPSSEHKYWMVQVKRCLNVFRLWFITAYSMAFHPLFMALNHVTGFFSTTTWSPFVKTGVESMIFASITSLPPQKLNALHGQ